MVGQKSAVLRIVCRRLLFSNVFVGDASRSGTSFAATKVSPSRSGLRGIRDHHGFRWSWRCGTHVGSFLWFFQTG